MVDKLLLHFQTYIRYYIFGACFFLFIVLVILIVLAQKSQPQNHIKQTTQAPNNSPQPSIANRNDTQKTQSLPKVSVSSWVDNSTQKPTSLSSIEILSFKTNIALVSIAPLAQSFGIDKLTTNNYGVVGYETEDKKDFMLYNIFNGTFILSDKTNSIAINPQDTNSWKQLFTQVGIYDSSLSLYGSYKKRDQAGKTYYEFHRNWQTAKLPILNPLGLMNITESKTLHSLSIGDKETLSRDENIVNTSDNSDGYARANDFNTVTAVLDDQNKLIAIESQMRPLDTNSVQIAELINYESALAELRANNTEFIYTLPSGAGSVDMTKVYPNNQAIASQAVITDVILAYLESPLSIVQNTLKPSYIFKGYAQLSSGYRVRFIAGVDAVQKKNAFKIFPNIEAHAAEPTYYDSHTQKQGTFNIPTIIPVSPTTSINTPTFILPTATVDDGCDPSISQLNPQYTINNILYGYYDTRNHSHYPGFDGVYFVVPPQSLFSIHSKPELAVAIVDLVKNIYDKIDGWRGVENVMNSFNAYRREGKVCPVRLTGPSPSLFIYGNPGEKIIISTKNINTTYIDPPQITNTWEVVIGDDESLSINGVTRNYLYYEYIPKQWEISQEGWFAYKNQLKTFVFNTLKPLFEYSDSESLRLVDELTMAAKDIQSDKLKISLTNNSQIEKNLPLEISKTNIKTFRYHFSVSEYKKHLSPPRSVSPIKRRPEMLVELGAFPAQ